MPKAPPPPYLNVHFLTRLNWKWPDFNPDGHHLSFVSAHPLELELTPRVITAAKGSGVVLTCRASGCPQPALSWGSDLDEPVHGQTHTQGPVSELHLRALGLSDERAYICEAKCGSVVKSKHAEVKVFCECKGDWWNTLGERMREKEARMCLWELTHARTHTNNSKKKKKKMVVNFLDIVIQSPFSHLSTCAKCSSLDWIWVKVIVGKTFSLSNITRYFKSQMAKKFIVVYNIISISNKWWKKYID